MIKGKALVFGLLLLFFGQALAQESIPLWEGYHVPHGKQVTLTPYLADSNEMGLAIIVCPGGSYFWLDEKTEGDGVAQWLQKKRHFCLRVALSGGGFRRFLLASPRHFPRQAIP